MFGQTCINLLPSLKYQSLDTEGVALESGHRNTGHHRTNKLQAILTCSLLVE